MACKTFEKSASGKTKLYENDEFVILNKTKMLLCSV